MTRQQKEEAVAQEDFPKHLLQAYNSDAKHRAWLRWRLGSSQILQKYSELADSVESHTFTALSDRSDEIMNAVRSVQRIHDEVTEAQQFARESREALQMLRIRATSGAFEILRSQRRMDRAQSLLDRLELVVAARS